MLTEWMLNRALLARQGLLTRHAGSIPDVLSRIGGIQAQYAPAMYVGLWSRTAPLTRTDVTRALEDRSAVQGTLLRGTIHLVAREDYWPMVQAIRGQRRAGHLRALRHDPPESVWLDAADRLRHALADGPLTRRQIVDLLGTRLAGAISIWLDLVRVPPAGTWERRSADLFGLATDWVGSEPGGDADELAAAGAALLVRRYLRGFGPARPADIASWAGLSVTTINHAVGTCDDVVTVPATEGKPLVDLVDLVEFAIASGAAPPSHAEPLPVRFLPTWDAALLVHARRTQVLPEEYRPLVFSIKNPHSVGTYLVDGHVAGSWTWRDEAIRLTEYVPLTSRQRAAVEGEADLLAAFHR